MFHPASISIPRYHAVGLPPRSFAFSNSERMEMGCDRRWFFRYGERLAPKEEIRALRYGDAWARCLEDIYRWWMVTDQPYPYDQVLMEGSKTQRPKGSCPWCSQGQRICSVCDNNQLSRPFLIAADWRQDEAEGRMEDAESEIETLFNALIGYRVTYGDSPPDDYRIVGVEQEVAAPIIGLDGRPFRSKIPMVRVGSTWRLSLPGEEPTDWTILPWYQIGKLDVILQHRKSGSIWVQEAKSSRDPDGYLRNITVDPQTTGYVWMLRELQRQGVFSISGEIVGVQFDIASSSKQGRPERLVEKELAKKAPERDLGFTHQPPAYSKAKNRITPSWLYFDTLMKTPPGPDGQRLDPRDYADHIDYLREQVDPKLYLREPMPISPQALYEYEVEIVGVAQQLAEKIRRLPSAFGENVWLQYPRTPLCRKPGGSCPFTGLCSGSEPEIKNDFEIVDGLTWEMPLK